ncbi:MAG TPA: DUF2203 domain-containing protein [Actinomycetota bacterium]
MSETRRYTLEEATATLGRLRTILPAIRDARHGLIAASERITEAVGDDGGGVEGSDWFRHQQSLRAGLEELASLEILLRDPETGLVDFPSERDGEPVYLCWRLGEPAIGFFHTEHAGFTGRQPL